MNKQEFLATLRNGLSGLPQDDLEERLTFYSEMIEDQMEEGLSEEEAVLAVGSAPEIIAQIAEDLPLAKNAKAIISPEKQRSTGEILLLTLGSPIWLSLGIAAFAVIVSLYISLWAVIIFLWAVFASLAACSIGGMLTCMILVASGSNASGLAMLAAGMVCAGLSIFVLYGSKAATNGILMLTKKVAIWIRNRFIKKEEA